MMMTMTMMMMMMMMMRGVFPRLHGAGGGGAQLPPWG
jgi:hypothetical protein